jgi:hypothetical protein
VLVNSWHWAAALEWWQRGIVGALVGAVILILIPAALSRASSSAVVGIGGRGGSGSIEGGSGTIIGGRGGEGGIIGRGGEGGGGSIQGGGGTIIGGDGGNAGAADGRGGKPTRSPGEVAGLPTTLWPYGRGGAGANDPEYDRRLGLLAKFRKEYLNVFPDSTPFIDAGVDSVPVTWINMRLEETGETWRVHQDNGGYKLPPLK